MDQQQQHKGEASQEKVASALQTEELLNSLLLQGAFGTPEICTARTAAVNAEETKENQRSPEVFVNKGLATWESKRQEWLHHRNTADVPRHAMELDVDEVIDTLFASSRPNADPIYFSTSIPLPQMIDILQDLWEAEGLET